MKHLSELQRTDSLSFGNKASNLGVAMKEGLLVPQGFALSFEEFEEYLLFNHIIVKEQSVLAYGEELRNKIMNGSFPKEQKEELTSRIHKLYEQTGCTSLVVRSSSCVEDGNKHSMAGMFESYLGLHTYSEVEEAVKQCFAALYSDRVLQYMFENGIDYDKLKMGVLIQEYVVSKPSGILFTADTISMQESLLQVTAVDSICSDFENNSKPSALYSMDKLSGEIRSETIPEGAPVLTYQLLHQLRELAVTTERLFGNYLDIEWTYAQDKLMLLQIRPITTFTTKKFEAKWEDPEQAQYIWYGLMPEPYPPIMEDISAIEVEQLSEGAYETLFRTDTYGTSIIINGYRYVRNYPIENEQEKRAEYLAGLEEKVKQGICIYHDEILPKLQDILQRIEPYVGRTLTAKEISEYLKLSLEYLKVSYRYHWPAVQANEALYRFESEILQKYPELSLEDFYDLVYGFTMLSRDRELLFRMSALVKLDDELYKLFDRCPYDAVLYERLIRMPQAKQLIELIETYVSEYGVCDSGDDVVLHPVVMERPDYIIGSLREVLTLEDKVFFDHMQTAPMKKEKIKRYLLQSMKEEEQNEFLIKLSVAEKAFITNDNHNHYMERMYRGHLRLAVMEAGRLLCTGGMLEKAEDIMYLHIDEIFCCLEGDNISKQLINQRIEEYHENKRMGAPEIIGNCTSLEEQEEEKQRHTQILRHLTKDEENNQEDEKPPLITLKGVSGLHKIVRGKVYVGMSEHLNEECILVLPHSHCGNIMPHLNKIKGLIFHWGSPYDHPGIIARELGIPAIYKTNTAMNLLHTGDEVELNGYTGVVTIVSQANPKP